MEHVRFLNKFLANERKHFITTFENHQERGRILQLNADSKHNAFRQLESVFLPFLCWTREGFMFPIDQQISSNEHDWALYMTAAYFVEEFDTCLVVSSKFQKEHQFGAFHRPARRLNWIRPNASTPCGLGFRNTNKVFPAGRMRWNLWGNVHNASDRD